ncbi:MAG: hypothetical protein J5970_01530 [Bacilli bacterium]|nr:hypothetical protein [Bacilli bacterium]
MNERIEIYKHIYQDSEMSLSSLENLKNDLKDKDNKIKDILDDIISGFIEYKKYSEKELKKCKCELEEESTMAKMMAKMGIKKEVLVDNSDSHMADLLIQGISMGSINMEKKIDDYRDKIPGKDLKYAKKFLKFEQEKIEELKKYL